MLTKTKLNGTDLVVSEICYGTNFFGTAVDPGRAAQLLDQFSANGGNFIDTARAYGDWVPGVPAGASERTIGAWLKDKNRADFVIATKGAGLDMRSGNLNLRVTPDAIARDLAESREHLGIECIDLYWLHLDDPSKPIPPLLDALIEHQRRGAIRYFGASNWSPERIREAQSYARRIGHRGFAAIESFWGLATPNPHAAALQGYGQYYENALESIHAEGMPMVAYAGQSRGFFTKLALAGEGALDESLKSMYANDVNRARFKVLAEIAGKHGVSINQAGLAYLLSQPYQTIPILGAFRAEQLSDSLAAASVRLSATELRDLRNAK